MSMTIIIFLVISVIFCFLYMPFAKKRINKDYDRLRPLIDDPNVAKVALWIELNEVDGEPFTGEYDLLTERKSCHYWSDIKKAVLNQNPVGVALFKPGRYRFLVSSNTDSLYKNVSMDVEILAGQTYQLGCNEDGPYFVIDSNPARYEYKYKPN